MNRKSAAPLTHNLLARKGQATAAAWRAEAEHAGGGPNVVAMADRSSPTKPSAERGPRDQTSIHAPGPDAVAANGFTQGRLLALILVLAIAGGTAAFLILSPPTTEPPPPSAADNLKITPTVSMPNIALSAPRIDGNSTHPADKLALQPAAGPPPATQEPAAANADVEKVAAPPVQRTTPKAVMPRDGEAIAKPKNVAVIPAAPKIALPVITTVPKITNTAKPAAPVSAAAGRRYAVQFASLKTRAAALREWSRLKTRFAGLLADLEPTVQRAAVRQRGIFFRLRAGAFPSSGAARALCRAIQAKLQSCLVIRR